MTNEDSMAVADAPDDRQHLGIRALGDIVGEDLLAFMLALNLRRRARGVSARAVHWA